MYDDNVEVYHIITEIRAYGHVVGDDHVVAKAQFQIVRENWDDTSKVISGYRWNRESGVWDDTIETVRNW